MIFVVLVAVIVAVIVHVAYEKYIWGGDDFQDSNPYLCAGWIWPDGKKHNDPPPAIAHRFFISHNVFDSPRENFKSKFGSQWDTNEYSLRKKFVAVDVAISLAGGLIVLWLGYKLIF